MDKNRRMAPPRMQQASAASHQATDDQDVFVQTMNPLMAEEQKRKGGIHGLRGAQPPTVRKYERPDPSKKQVTSQDTPIRLNPSGQYNLNFIDWDNEWEAIMDRDPNSYESPIYGMDTETFEAIFDEEMFDTVRAQRGASDNVLKRLDTRTVNKVRPENMCAICVEQYRRGDKVFFLGCKHHYHTDCILPWL